MANASRLLVLLVSASVAAACGGRAAPEQPEPQPTQPAVTPPAVNQDSIDRARAEAEARERAERDRLAREEADRLARARATLLEQLGAQIHFDYDKADIQSEDEANLSRKAEILNANGGLRLRISGHADERGSDEYNLALGNRRAAAAKRFLVNKGIDAARLEVVSFGEERPVNPGSDEAAWAQNRRAEFEIIAGGDNLRAP